MATSVMNDSRTVLVIEDDLRLSNSLKLWLEAEEWRVYQASRIQQAWEIINTEPVDIIISDVYLGETESGLKLLQAVKQVYPDIKFILMTGLSAIETIDAAHELGAAATLEKPFTIEKLKHAIETQVPFKFTNHQAELEFISSNSMLDLQKKLPLNVKTALATWGIVSITDTEGQILYVNDSFCSVTGYSQSQLIGENHRLLKSGTHDAEFYRYMWETLKSKGIWRGQICNKDSTGKLFWLDTIMAPILNEQGKVIHYISISKNITEVKKTEYKYSLLTIHDQETRLLKSILLPDILQFELANIAEDDRLFILELAVNNLANILASYGENCANRVLVKISSTLKKIFPGAEITSARKDDNQLISIILVRQENNISDFQTLVDQLPENLQINDYDIAISLSGGYSEFPESSRNAHMLLEKAELALELAKHNKKRFINSNELMSPLRVNDHSFLEKVQNAMLKRELILFFQPQLNLRSGQVESAEALLRWRNQKQEMVSVGPLFAMIEKLGLAEQIDYYVIEQAMQCLSRWQNKQINIRLAVNVFPRTILNQGFYGKLRKLVERYRIQPGMLELELTEGSSLDVSEGLIALLKSLRILGISVALDDFGTGFAALQYLQLPADIIKIDRVFVDQVDKRPLNQSIIKSVMMLARDLNSQVIAEGIETSNEQAFLTQAGVDFIQGFYFARPMDEASLLSFLLSHNKGGSK